MSPDILIYNNFTISFTFDGKYEVDKSYMGKRVKKNMFEKKCYCYQVIGKKTMAISMCHQSWQNLESNSY